MNEKVEWRRRGRWEVCKSPWTHDTDFKCSEVWDPGHHVLHPSSRSPWIVSSFPNHPSVTYQNGPCGFVTVNHTSGFGLLHFMTVDPTPQLMGQPANQSPVLFKCILHLMMFYSSSMRGLTGEENMYWRSHLHHLLNALGPVDRRLAGGRWPEKDGVLHHHQGLIHRATKVKFTHLRSHISTMCWTLPPHVHIEVRANVAACPDTQRELANKEDANNRSEWSERGRNSVFITVYWLFQNFMDDVLMVNMCRDGRASIGQHTVHGHGPGQTSEAWTFVPYYNPLSTWVRPITSTY